LTLALSAAGAGMLVALNQVLGSASVGDQDQTSTSRSFSFVGDNLLAPMANSFRDVDLDAIMRGSNLFWLVPGILVAIATLVAGIRIIRGRWPGASPNIKTGAFVVLALYWFPMVIV